VVDRRFRYPKDAKGLYDEISGWNGRIIFALYSDSSLHDRLVDTGWIEWASFNLIGSSTAELDDRDKEIEHILNNKYIGRKIDVWASLKYRSPIDIWKPFLEQKQ
jgi:hypothetical protein